MKALKPLGFLYQKAAGLKNLLYDKQVLKSVKIPVPVISLGNLTMGGTGKTPLTHFCLQHFQNKKLKVAVVSRNYRAEVSEIARVDLGRADAAKFYGDEPVLLASKNPQATFYVGPEKFKTARHAYEDSKPDVILVDDGFQHRQLHRTLDVVILDATEPLSAYRCVPEGRAREPWASLERADAIFVSKQNLAGEAAVRSLLESLKEFKKPVVVFDFLSADRVLINGDIRGSELDPAKAQAGEKDKKVFAVSAIGRPQAFERTLEAEGAQVVAHRRFKDHHLYTAEDVQSILRDVAGHGAKNPAGHGAKNPAGSGAMAVVTTEKDAVKLKALWPATVPLWSVPLEVRIHSGEEAFHEIMAQVLR